MKNAKWMLALSLVALSTLSVAQTITSNGVKADVPFAFTVADKTIPSGECVVQRSGMDRNILLISNVEAKASLLSNSTMSEDRKNSENTVLVFERYGDRYFLSAIRLEGSNMTYHIPLSKAESELRAQNVTGTQETLLASLK